MQAGSLVYLAGPMSGLPDCNWPAFEAGAALLREHGYIVISPHEGGLREGTDEAQYHAMARKNMASVLVVDGLFVLPGWQSSRGAKAEIALAQFCGKPCALLPTGERWTGFMQWLPPDVVHTIVNEQHFDVVS